MTRAALKSTQAVSPLLIISIVLSSVFFVVRRIFLVKRKILDPADIGFSRTSMPLHKKSDNSLVEVSDFCARKIKPLKPFDGFKRTSLPYCCYKYTI